MTAAICLLALWAYGAQPSDSIAREKTLKAAVVTAVRRPQPTKDATELTRVISAEDIERAEASNVAELLQQELPGTEISYTMGRETSLNIGGSGGVDALFLIDGERLAGETMNNTDFSRLTLANVERIEITRGAPSALYGGNAGGTVINIITRKERRKLESGIDARAATHDDYRAGVRIGTRSGAWANTVSVRYTHRGGYTMSPFGESGTRQQLVSPRNHTWQADERLTWRPTKALTLTARAGYFFREREYDATQDNRYRDFTGGLRGEYRFSPTRSLEIAYTFDQYDKSDYARATGYDIRDYSNVQHTTRAVYAGNIGSHWTLTAGGAVMRDYLLSYQLDGSKTQLTANAFAQAEWAPGKRWELLAALQYNYFSPKEDGGLTGRLAARWRPIDGLTMRAAYNGGRRPPTLKELYMNFNMSGIFMLYGNERLKTERSHNIQVSAEWEKGGCNLSASLFHNIISNRITSLWDSSAEGLYGNRGAMRYRNIRSMTVSGFEANAAAQVNKHWDARLSYSLNHVATKGQPYSDDTRPHSLTARIGYRLTFGREVLNDKTGVLKSHVFTATLSCRWLSPMKVSETSDEAQTPSAQPTRYGGYCIVKLGAQLHTPMGFTLSLCADNPLNYRPSRYTYYSPKTTGTEFSVAIAYNL